MYYSVAKRRYDEKREDDEGAVTPGISYERNLIHNKKKVQESRQKIGH